jgi:hypothetical protein
VAARSCWASDDSWFYRTLSVLGAGEPRLVETQAGEPLPAAPPLSDTRAYVALSLKLTPAGEQVLGQNADRVKLLGVDRWVGGTHITTTKAWRGPSCATAGRASLRSRQGTINSPMTSIRPGRFLTPRLPGSRVGGGRVRVGGLHIVQGMTRA